MHWGLRNSFVKLYWSSKVELCKIQRHALNVSTCSIYRCTCIEKVFIIIMMRLARHVIKMTRVILVVICNVLSAGHSVLGNWKLAVLSNFVSKTSLHRTSLLMSPLQRISGSKGRSNLGSHRVGDSVASKICNANYKMHTCSHSVRMLVISTFSTSGLGAS